MRVTTHELYRVPDMPVELQDMTTELCRVSAKLNVGRQETPYTRVLNFIQIPTLLFLHQFTTMLHIEYKQHCERASSELLKGY